MMDETRARFLAAIAKQLPAERITEAHLFAAIRQGGMESGVAVIALEPERVAEETPVESSEDLVAIEATDGSVAEAADDAAEAAETSETPAEAETDTDADDHESPYADAVEAEVTVVAAPAPPRRYTVCTARYRHTLKGPDRGKWEVTVTEEADAPLLTVDAVVRGVQRRSGDVDEIVRLSGDEVRAALPAPATP
jgi:hypothetical protein